MAKNTKARGEPGFGLWRFGTHPHIRFVGRFGTGATRTSLFHSGVVIALINYAYSAKNGKSHVWSHRLSL
jgi:hypothetical protein